jgi:hypothetical protein
LPTIGLSIVDKVVPVRTVIQRDGGALASVYFAHNRPLNRR